MKTLRASFLKALLPFGALLALAPLAACIDPVIIGGNGSGGNGGSGGSAGACSADADCAAGQFCVNGLCTIQSGGDLCNGVPSPVSCTVTGCPADQVCTPDADPNSCHPSTCSCDPMSGWVCTADCGFGGSTCQPGSCTPAPEICNGIDDDCDGQIDELNDPAAPLCADGTACVNGQCGMVQCGPNGAGCPPNMVCDASGMCVPVCAGTPEICNGVDDDCDGVVDNATPGAVLCPNGGSCVNGSCGVVIGCMADADCPPNMFCDAATATCTAFGCMPAPESCNGVDDDCDGLVDDGAFCANGAVCVNGQCGGVVQCGPNQPCPAGQVCNPNGVCSVTQCASNADCPAGSTCQNGLCQ